MKKKKNVQLLSKPIAGTIKSRHYVFDAFTVRIVRALSWERMHLGEKCRKSVQFHTLINARLLVSFLHNNKNTYNVKLTLPNPFILNEWVSSLSEKENDLLVHLMFSIITIVRYYFENRYSGKYRTKDMRMVFRSGFAVISFFPISFQAGSISTRNSFSNEKKKNFHFGRYTYYW